MTTKLLYTCVRALAREAGSILGERAPMAGLAIVLGIAAPLAASMTGAAPGHGTAGQRSGMGLTRSALAAPEAQPSASPSSFAPGTAAATGPVQLPAFNAPEPTGPAPMAPAGWRLLVPSVGLQVGVVNYGDCSGNTPMTRASAVRYTCTPAAVTAFVGHNPGVFTPLLRTHAGDRVIFQHDGVEDVYILGSPRRVSPAEAADASQDGSYIHALFATCAEPDSSAYWIFTASPLGGAAPAPSPRSGGGQSTTGGGPGGGGAASPHPTPSPKPGGGGTPGGSLPVPLPSPPPPPI